MVQPSRPWGVVYAPFSWPRRAPQVSPGPSFNLERELIERRYTELRQEGRRLSGVVVNYGDVAVLPFGRERFEPGAFSPIGDVILNVQHDRGRPLARTGGGLFLEDSATALTIRAELPHTTEADNVLALVKARVLRGLSMEFRSVSERQENEVRVVERANLSGLGVVDSGAYPSSTVEARRRGGRGGRRRRRSFTRSRIPYKKTLGCECHRGTCNKVRFNKGAFDEAINSDDVDVLAIAGGDFSRAMASKNRGSLVLKSSDDGLDIALGRAAGLTPAGRELAATEKSVSIFARPIFDQDKSIFTESEIGGETVATYSRVHLRAVLFKPIAEPGDWPEVEFFSTAQGQRREAVQDAKERRRVWL